jgi:hypothetical protein
MQKPQRRVSLGGIGVTTRLKAGWGVARGGNYIYRKHEVLTWITCYRSNWQEFYKDDFESYVK